MSIIALAAYAQSAPDYFSIKTIADLALAPDGKTALFTVSTPDVAANRTVSRLMQIAIQGGEPSPVAGAPEGANSLRWAPDGKRFAYLASDAIWIQSLGGFEAAASLRLQSQ